jgi:hypothetical protein
MVEQTKGVDMKKLNLALILFLCLISSAFGGQYLRFDSQTGSWTPGNTLYGATLGASATISSVTDNGSTGKLYLTGISGTFQDDEIIYEASYGSELVINGNMEFDSDWNDFGAVTSNTRSDEQAHGGTYSRKLVIPAGGGGCSQVITTETGSFYVINGWLYISILDALWITFLMRDSSANNFGELIVNTTGQWVHFSTIGMSPDGGTGYVACFGSGTTGDSTCYLDDVSVKKITNTALANGILYGGGKAAQSW